MSRPTLIVGRGGLGDAIYARPFVREALRHHEDVHVVTSWPWVFSDLPVKPVKRLRGLKVQAYHGDRVPAGVWTVPPRRARTITLRYRWERLARQGSVTAEMEVLSGLHPNPLTPDLPPLPESPVSGRYAVVRPPAVRLDFPAPAREPDPEYLTIASLALQARGYRVVTIGAWVPGLEEPNGPPVPADVRYEYGELSIPQTLALIAGAVVAVGGPCFLIPACVATGTPLVVVAGGLGAKNSPRALVDERLGADHVRWLLPESYCMCGARDHACPKEIPDFPGQLAAALDHAAALQVAA